MKLHDCTGLNDAQCLHADHFFARFEHWRDRGISDEMRFRVTRGEAQRKHPLDELERAVMDDYLRERAEVKKWSGSNAEHYIEPIESMFDVH